MLKKSYLILFLVCLLWQVSKAGQASAGDSLILPAKLAKFIPAGYALLDTATGDLNLDKYKDLILVLKAIGEENPKDTGEFKRPLMLLLGNADKTFTLAARNDNIVYCYSCGGAFGDPYAGVEIKKGSFTVHHYGGSNDRWSNDIRFKYSPTNKAWMLEKTIDNGWNISNPNKVETQVKTRKDFGTVLFTEFSSEQ